MRLNLPLASRRPFSLTRLLIQITDRYALHFCRASLAFPAREGPTMTSGLWARHACSIQTSPLVWMQTSADMRRRQSSPVSLAEVWSTAAGEQVGREGASEGAAELSETEREPVPKHDLSLDTAHAGPN